MDAGHKPRIILRALSITAILIAVISLFMEPHDRQHGHSFVLPLMIISPMLSLLVATFVGPWKSFES